MNALRTDLLEIMFEQSGPEEGRPVLLLHGWPDAPRGWSGVAHHLHAEGWRTITPYLRGSRPTRFLREDTIRFAGAVALAQDAIDLADGLRLDRFAVIGHDWGARVAYTLAALFPERITAIAALALGYQPRGVFTVPDFHQSMRFWYQWFQCVDGGAEAVRRDPVGFALIQWNSWSPPGWFDEAEFVATADSFKDPDWAAITLNAYRARWLPGEAVDRRYDALREKLSEIDYLSTPTLMIQGGSDSCDAPKQSEGLDHYFTRGYRRIVLEGIGHFPHREAAHEVGDAISGWLRDHGKI
jgi:pimeloyl-ACP methyl ester carboxylesterase